MAINIVKINRSFREIDVLEFPQIALRRQINLAKVPICRFLKVLVWQYMD